MGRHKKTVMTEDGVDRRKNGYYSTPSFVTDFITGEMLALKGSGKTVLDPCVGKEEMVHAFHAAGKAVTGWDVEDFGVHEKAAFEERDFLAFYGERVGSCSLGQSPELAFDYYVANPPYNCHESSYIRSHKKRLQALFPETGVANMYSMFMSAMITLAKPGAVLGIITNDSFLTARLHEGLRKQILTTCRVTHLLLCPVDLFWSQRADVRTCIVILVKEGADSREKVLVLNRPADTAEFRKALEQRRFENESIEDLVLDSDQDRSEFVVGCPEVVRDLFKAPRLGEMFRCVTGISTGSDSKYLRKTPDARYTVPFYKNPGTRRFFMEPDAYLPSDFLEIDKQVSNFMVRNKDLLFKPGIACSSMGIPFGACALPAGATYGVNANVFCDGGDRMWLLAYLNSSLVTYFVRGVLLRTNMITSGYVARIPIVPVSTVGKQKLAEIAEEAVCHQAGKDAYPGIIDAIDAVVFADVGLPKKVVQGIKNFSADIMKRT